MYHGRLSDSRNVTIRRVTVSQPSPSPDKRGTLASSMVSTTGGSSSKGHSSSIRSEEWREVCNEVRVLQSLRHRSIVSLLGLCGEMESRGEVAVVTARMERGSLEEALHARSSAGEGRGVCV